MRSLLMALLITVFAGVHTAAALGVGQTEVSGDTSLRIADKMMTDTGDMRMTHNSQCCGDTDTFGGAGCFANCSIDCGTFCLVEIAPDFVSERTIERTPVGSLSSVFLRKPDHPPKQG